MYILGVSAFYHDSAACLIKDGGIISAAQEERFSRIKHDSHFPVKAIKYCLSQAGIRARDISNVVFYEKPFLKFERLLETYLSFAPRGFSSFKSSMPVWVTDKLFQKSRITALLHAEVDDEVDWQKKLLFSEHHLSHAASAFFPSPFDKAAILTVDGVGEWATTTCSVGSSNKLEILKEIQFPHSLGLLYSAFTHYVGFKVNSGEYKLMGLAPYGKPRYTDLIKKNLVSIMSDGSFHLNMTYFNYGVGLTMTNEKFHDLFGGPPRQPESNLTERHMNIAASIQKVTEEIVIKLAQGIRDETKESNLCLAGGVALNCVANGILLRKKVFENIWIQPAAGDAGGALGAALAVWHLRHKKKRKIHNKKRDAMAGTYLGPSYSDNTIQRELENCGAVFSKVPEEKLINQVAYHLSNGKAIGWMQGRMEFGPRALGNRSILADPRSPDMQKQLNLKVKYRESFRPFAPSILKEHLSEWFEINEDSPYMLLVADIVQGKRLVTSKATEKLTGIDKLKAPRSEVPAITHVDYSARIQTVHSHSNPKFHKLIGEFHRLTGCPLVINTSFNIRGEPIVCTAKDAFSCFMGTELDLLAIENFLLFKKNQKTSLLQNYRSKYKLD